MTFALLAMCAEALAAGGSNDVSSASALRPLRSGYAFNQPRVLAQQRLFGVAHGVSLLAATCVREAGYRDTLTLDYIDWRERQEPTIAMTRRELAQYYFADRADEADEQDIADALNLARELAYQFGFAPGSMQLHAACDTFAAAIKKPRYDLNRQLQLQTLAARLAAATATAARIEFCRGVLAGEEAAQLDAAASQWQQTYGAAIEEARSSLEQHWADTQIDGTLATWLTQARQDEKNNRNTEACHALPAWLSTPQADPDDAFKP